MNKRGLILIIAIVAFFGFSCSKNWVCTCTLGGSGGAANTGASYTFTSTIKYTTKGDAQTKCDKLAKDTVSNGTYVCHIE